MATRCSVAANGTICSSCRWTGTARWYRYHHLFADALREQLGRTATEDDIDDLHRRAAAWLEANGYVEDAIRHAIAGRDWAHAVRLLEDGLRRAVRARSHRDAAHLAAGDPAPRPRHLAATGLLARLGAGRTGRWSGGSAALRIAEEAWTATGDRRAKGWSSSGMRSAALCAVNNRQAIDYAQRALDALPADRPIERILALMTQGIGHLHHGEPVAAEAVFSEVRTLIDTSGRSWLRPFEMTYSAAVLMQQGRLLEASMLCRQVIQAAGDRATGDLVPNGAVPARVHLPGVGAAGRRATRARARG